MELFDVIDSKVIRLDRIVSREKPMQRESPRTA